MAVDVSPNAGQRQPGRSGHQATTQTQAGQVDFTSINDKALENLEFVLEWLQLDTKPAGKEIQFINPLRNDADFGSASINSETGVWADFAEDDAKGGDVTSLVAYVNGSTQVEAARKLEKFLADLDTPHQEPAPIATAVANTVALTGRGKPAEEEGSMLYPIPNDAPDIPSTFWKLGTPSKGYTYRDAEGRTLGYIARFDTKAGKEIRPLTLWRSPYGLMSWKIKGFPKPHPLYRLDELANRPDAQVLVVEGEKAADAAVALFPDSVVTTAMHGSQSVDKADLSSLYGRKVVIWPDHDNAGQKYARDIAEILVNADPPASVSIMQILTVSPGRNEEGDPMLVPGFAASQGWDAADALEMGWTAEHIALLPESVFTSAAASSRPVRFGNFEVSDAGVFHFKETKNGVVPIRISSRIDVDAQTRDEANQNWGMLLRFKDRDGHQHEWSMPRELLGRVDEYRRQLLNLGVDLAQKGPQDPLTEYFMAVNPAARALNVSKTGWHGNVFILPDRTYGDSEERVILQTQEAIRSSHYATSGTLDDWKREVGELCVFNSRLILAVNAALAGPFLQPLGEENGGFHFRGASSSGKTKTLSVAASVWGDKGMVRVWRTTGNAIESLAIEHNDTVLILDELGQVSPQDAGDIAYTLANGQQKARATRTGAVRDVGSWRLLFLSTGEIGLADHVAAGGGRIKAGQEVRMLDIPADGGAGMGVFQDIYNSPSPQAFADTLQEMSEKYYGTPAEALLARLTSTPGEMGRALATIKAAQSHFVENYVPAEANGQVIRAAGRFGLVAGVGEYCTEIGILPLEADDSLNAAGQCFHAWLESRGGIVASEEIRALAQVREFLEHHGESRFTRIEHDGFENNVGQRTVNRTGFRKVLDDGSAEYWVLPEAYKSDICEGFDPKLVTRVLVEKGFLEVNQAGEAQITKRLPGVSGEKNLTRMYVIKPLIFQEPAEASSEAVTV